MKVKYVKWGLANFYEDGIELNENLKKYPKLHNYILLHEKGHKEGFDISHEFKFKFRFIPLMILFCLRYPRTLIDLSPVTLNKGRICYDINKTILYITAFFLIIILKLIL
jgi:hypothetical protein